MKNLRGVFAVASGVCISEKVKWPCWARIKFCHKRAVDSYKSDAHQKKKQIKYRKKTQLEIIAFSKHRTFQYISFQEVFSKYNKTTMLFGLSFKL